jgi:ankyrin repeat protein
MKDWFNLLRHGALEAIERRLHADPSLALANDPNLGHALEVAILRDHLPLVERLLSLGASPKDSPTGRFPVSVHVRSIPVAEALERCGAEFSSPVALHAAMRRGDPSLAAWLLRRGAKPDADALFEAGPEMRDTVIAGADARQLQLLLVRAAEEGDEACVECALAAGADPVGTDALHRAAETDHPRIIQRLVDAGVPVDVVDEWGTTPLIAAAWEGSSMAVRLLAEMGADPTRRNSHGQDALAGVLAAGDEALVAFLEAAISGGSSRQFRQDPRGPGS